ncbi:MAG: hypothetical protein PHU14_05765 [Methylovulum sp.]|nr:hypothetical protein [Methylovulum sp.]
MSAFTNYTENQLANHLFRTAAFAKPTSLYVGLFSAVADGEAGSVTELSGNGYARASCAPGDGNWNAPVSGNGTVSNAVAITFPAATADWGTISHWGIFDASSTGNLLVYAPLSSARTITAGSTPSFAVGALTVQIDN